MQHGQLYNLSHLVDLLLAATDVTVGDVWLLFNSHHGDASINFRGKRDLDLVLGTIHPADRQFSHSMTTVIVQGSS